MNKFFKELQRRNVIKASISYVVLGWVILQVADILFPAFNIPDTAIRYIFYVLIVCFPIWVVFAYVYESTPTGFKKTDEVEKEQSIRVDTNKKLNYYIIGGLSLAVTLLVIDRVFNLTFDSADLNMEKSVAILPFNNLSASEDSYFAAGMTEDILTQISQIDELRVLSNYTLNSYDYEGKSPETMGKELGVSYILAGNVRRSNDNLRISCQLIGTNNEGTIWAKSYDKRMTNMFDLQAEIAREIAGTLAASLSEEEKEQLERKPTENLVAYDLYLKAREFTKAFAKDEDRFKGIELYKEAISLDSTFSIAYSGLASAYIFGIKRFGAFPGNYLDTAFLLAQKGVDLGPEYASTWGTLGTAYSQLGKREQAASMYKKVLEINPNSPSALNNLSNYYSAMGQFDKSIEMYKRSIQTHAVVDSTVTVPYQNLAHDYRQLGLLDNALLCAQKAVAYKAYHSSLFQLGLTQYAVGDTVESFRTLRRIVRESNNSLPSLALTAGLYYQYDNQDSGIYYMNQAKAKETFHYDYYSQFRIYEALELQKVGQYDSAKVLFDQNLEFYLSRFEQGVKFQGWLYNIAAIYVALGNEKEAFNWLQKLIDDGHSDYDEIHESILFDPIKDHPEYIRIMGELKDRLDAMRQRVIDAEASEQLKSLRL